MTQTIFLVDDDRAVLDSISMLLAAHDYKVECFETAEAFLNADVVPGCIVSDVRMPGLTGIDLLKRLKADGDKRPVILITGHGDIEMAVQAIKAGALEFIEKPFDDQKLLTAVSEALTASESTLAQSQEIAELKQKFDALTERQRETMKCLIRGMANKQIALELGISPRTVEIHRTWVMYKMAANTLADLIRMGLALGLR
jgi:two-component system response regulator FixJ